MTPQRKQQNQPQTSQQQINSQSGSECLLPIENIWSGVLEWPDKSPAKVTRSVQCQVSSSIKVEPSIKSNDWPPKLHMQLMPKHIVGIICGEFLKDSKTVYFKMSPGEALENLLHQMNHVGYAGCVYFNIQNENCPSKMLIMLYTPEEKIFLGFLPNNQTGFVERMKKFLYPLYD